MEKRRHSCISLSMSCCAIVRNQELKKGALSIHTLEAVRWRGRDRDKGSDRYRGQDHHSAFHKVIRMSSKDEVIAHDFCGLSIDQTNPTNRCHTLDVIMFSPVSPPFPSLSLMNGRKPYGTSALLAGP